MTAINDLPGLPLSREWLAPLFSGLSSSGGIYVFSSHDSQTHPPPTFFTHPTLRSVKVESN